MIPFAMAAEWSDESGQNPAKLEDIMIIAEKVLNIIVLLAGFAVFMMLIVGGFQYLTAGGDPKKTQAASSTLTFAIIGLVVVLLAWFIMLFIEKFTGLTITEFNFLDLNSLFIEK
jgi:hypothetical protein